VQGRLERLSRMASEWKILLPNGAKICMSLDVQPLAMSPSQSQAQRSNLLGEQDES
jgi:hypothetical protein